MKQTRAAAIVGSLVMIAVVWGAVPPAGADDHSEKMKKLMGENFAVLQSILASLITANYAAVPDQLKLIEDHAEELTDMVPESAEGDRARYLSYAYNLGAHSRDLNSIVRTLMEHDAGKPQLATDQLREAAAAHYGGMVTMCVSCHNRFRPNVVQ